MLHNQFYVLPLYQEKDNLSYYSFSYFGSYSSATQPSSILFFKKNAETSKSNVLHNQTLFYDVKMEVLHWRGKSCNTGLVL